MEQIGYVVKAAEGRARVRVDRESACGGNCVSCKGCPSSAVIVECNVDNDIKKGDKVRLIMPTGRFFKNVFWGYGLSVILMVLGAVLGYKLGGTDGASLIGAFLGLVIGIGALKLIFSGKKAEISATRYE